MALEAAATVGTLLALAEGGQHLTRHVIERVAWGPAPVRARDRVVEPHRPRGCDLLRGGSIVVE